MTSATSIASKNLSRGLQGLKHIKKQPAYVAAEAATHKTFGLLQRVARVLSQKLALLALEDKGK